MKTPTPRPRNPVARVVRAIRPKTRPSGKVYRRRSRTAKKG